MLPLQQGSLQWVSGPTNEPVTKDEVKANSRLDSVPEGDAYLDALITGSRQLVSQITGRALTTETWKLVLDDWPRSGGRDDDWWDGVREGAITMLDVAEIDIAKAPFLAVTSVELLDESAAATAWAASNYYTSAEHGMGRLIKKRGVVWPTTLRDKAGIVITFTAGYGTNASDVPMALRQAVKDLAGHWYENREAAMEMTLANVPLKTMAIINMHKVAR